MAFAPMIMKVDLQTELTEQLNIEEVFGFDVGGTHIGFDESTVVSWIIMAALTLIAFILTRNLKVQGEISKRQALLELCYEKSVDFFKGLQKIIPEGCVALTAAKLAAACYVI